MRGSKGRQAPWRGFGGVPQLLSSTLAAVGGAKILHMALPDQVELTKLGGQQ